MEQKSLRTPSLETRLIDYSVDRPKFCGRSRFRTTAVSQEKNQAYDSAVLSVCGRLTIFELAYRFSRKVTLTLRH
jgi:hypothetical protein